MYQSFVNFLGVAASIPLFLLAVGAFTYGLLILGHRS
jgi:uncharacterized integral membrane protein